MAASGQHDLVSEIDHRQCWALNASKEHPLSDCLSAERRMLGDAFLQSDCDEELLIHITFVQKVRLSGIQIKAPATNGPKSVKLIVNTPSLDFDSAKSTKTTQEVELSPEALVGNAKVDLKLALFNSVGELTLLIEGNHADEEETIVNSLALWGSVIEIVGKRNDAPHLGKWSEDRGVEQYEKNASK